MAVERYRDAAGSIGRAVYASPDYLARHGAPAAPPDLVGHACIGFADGAASLQRWSFGRDDTALTVGVRPRLGELLADA